MKETYTIIYHRFVDSLAGQLLSPGGFMLLFDFLRIWKRKTLNGKRRCHAISFTWTGSARNVTRDTWRRYRGELVRRGFITKVSEAGLYRLSDRWQTYEPTDDELERQKKRAAEKRKKAMTTKEYRAKKLGLGEKARKESAVDRASNLGLGEGGVNLGPGGRAQKWGPGKGPHNRTLSITKNIAIPPLYPPSELQNPSNGVSSEGDIFDEFPTEERPDAE